MSETILQDASVILLLEKEKQYEDDFVDNEFLWLKRKADIIDSWSKLLHKLFDMGVYKRPLNTISGHIRARLRLRGISEGALDYVTEVIDKIYRNSNLDTRSGNSDGFPSHLIRPDVYEDFDNIASHINFKSEFKPYSMAEQYEIIRRGEQQDKETVKRIRDRQKMRREFAEENGIAIPEFEKESAEIPPERFWGESELYSQITNLKTKISRILDRVTRVQETVKQFCPTPEIAHKSASLLQDYMDTNFMHVERMINFWLDGFEDIFINYDDAKYGTHLGGWMKIAYDQIVNAGSHGSGMINSVQSGLFPMFLSKDGKQVYAIPIKRPFTREQVGDQTGKVHTENNDPEEITVMIQTNLQKKALNIITKDKVERAFEEWSDKTIILEPGMHPEEFYKMEMEKRRKEK